MSHRLLGGSAQARSERLAISSSLKKTAVQYQRTRRPVLRTKPADQAEDRRHRNRLKNRIPRNTAKYGRSDLVGNARLLSFVPKLFSPRVAPSSGQRGGGRQVYFKSLTVSGGDRSPRVQRSALNSRREQFWNERQKSCVAAQIGVLNGCLRMRQPPASQLLTCLIGGVDPCLINLQRRSCLMTRWSILLTRLSTV